MPNYSAVGRSLMGAARGAFTGAGGRALQGAAIGAAAGGLYGAISDRQTIMGGMMGGAVRGAMIGAGISAFKGGMSARGLAKRVGAGATMGDFLRGARRGGQADFRKSVAYARSSYGQVASTWGKSVNPIASTMKTTAEKAKIASSFFGMREARGFGMPRGGYRAPTMRAPVKARGRKKFLGMF